VLGLALFSIDCGRGWWGTNLQVNQMQQGSGLVEKGQV
jgi:hypothetical protein